MINSDDYNRTIPKLRVFLLLWLIILLSFFNVQGQNLTNPKAWIPSMCEGENCRIRDNKPGRKQYQLDSSSNPDNWIPDQCNGPNCYFRKEKSQPLEYNPPFTANPENWIAEKCLGNNCTAPEENALSLVSRTFESSSATSGYSSFRFPRINLIPRHNLFQFKYFADVNTNFGWQHGYVISYTGGGDFLIGLDAGFGNLEYEDNRIEDTDWDILSTTGNFRSLECRLGEFDGGLILHYSDYQYEGDPILVEGPSTEESSSSAMVGYTDLGVEKYKQEKVNIHKEDMTAKVESEILRGFGIYFLQHRKGIHKLILIAGERNVEYRGKTVTTRTVTYYTRPFNKIGDQEVEVDEELTNKTIKQNTIKLEWSYQALDDNVILEIRIGGKYVYSDHADLVNNYHEAWGGFALGFFFGG